MKDFCCSACDKAFSEKRDLVAIYKTFFFFVTDPPRGKASRVFLLYN
jgi:hypothetical protein